MSEKLERASWRIDVSGEVDLEGHFEIAADVVLPASEPVALVFCLPGGFLSRSYFDLGDRVDPVERSYSMAEHLVGRGYAVTMLDHLGCGDSTRPSNEDDAYRLDVDAISRANQCAWAGVQERLRDHYALPIGRELRSIGLGHSMGSALTVSQQANHAPHMALVLQSFSTAGLRAFLQEDEESYANDPERIRAAMPELVRKRFGSPYPGATNDEDEGSSAAFSVGTAPPIAEELLHRAATNLLGMAGLLTLIPGGYAPYAEAIEVPVFIATGDRDLGRANLVPPMLPKAREVVAYTLRDSRHCHNVANTRAELWDRTADWLDGVVRRA